VSNPNAVGITQFQAVGRRVASRSRPGPRVRVSRRRRQRPSPRLGESPPSRAADERRVGLRQSEDRVTRSRLSGRTLGAHVVRRAIDRGHRLGDHGMWISRSSAR
jgi:hypothetical protein